AQTSTPPASSPSTPQPAPAESRPEVASGVLFDIATTSGATDVQAELQSRGFYQGKVDGHWGAQSQAALLAWKVSAGLAPDAIWDRATERTLMGE
ncbi:MAG TPA: peptidoglycan-binding domain-containing protein, partial [Dongiaceae bacterium]|nr:peptidoglycan-binding domain-containing protein [Dongiaceae bacterium]